MNIEQIVGLHPLPPDPCGVILSAIDKMTDQDVPHRTLENDPLKQDELIMAMTRWIVSHHISPEAMERDRVRREALERQGLTDPTQRLPSNTSTQKGNWAEILLAEYITASSNAKLLVYRLRYNPNVDQSMKGDDVLVFDLNSNPVRVLVGEAKFRSNSTHAVVSELIESLERSHLGNIPASLQFVADRLFDNGQNELGAKVAECNALFAQSRLQLDYVGLLVSNKHAHTHVSTTAQSNVPRLAVMSLVLTDPGTVVADCYAKAAVLI